MPIYGFVGPLGSGKTHLMVKRGLELAYRRKAVLVSFIKITPSEASGIEFRQIGLNDYGIDESELLGEINRARAMGKGVVVLLDEVGILLPAREIRAMSRRLMFAFSQSRKMGVDLLWTAQNAGQVDAFLRRLTEQVTRCKAWPKTTLERFDKGKRPMLLFQTMWPPDDVGKRDKRMGWSVEMYDRRVEDRYNTLELVEPPADAIEEEEDRRRSRTAKRRTTARSLPPAEPVAVASSNGHEPET